VRFLLKEVGSFLNSPSRLFVNASKAIRISSSYIGRPHLSRCDDKSLRKAEEIKEKGLLHTRRASRRKEVDGEAARWMQKITTIESEDLDIFVSKH